MKTYSIEIEDDALQDIQDATDWYNHQSSGLGIRFQKQVIQQIDSLKKSPNSYSIRYSDVRCMLIKKFPFLVHYIVKDSSFAVKVFAVIHTSRNPRIWFHKRVGELNL